MFLCAAGKLCVYVHSVSADTGSIKKITIVRRELTKTHRQK